jgi:hypothetical protein
MKNRKCSMNVQNLKLIVKNLKSLVNCLESEIYSNTDNYKYDEIAPHLDDYDEIFEEDDYQD